MSKKMTFILSALSIVLLFFAVSCGGQAANVNTDSNSVGGSGENENNKAQSKNSSNKEVIEWTMYTDASSGDFVFQATQWLVDEIETRTEGQLQITIYPGGSLPYKQAESLDIVSKGLVDMSHVYGLNVGATEPRLQVPDIPGVMPIDPEKRFAIMESLLPSYQEFLSEKYNVNVYSLYIRHPRNIHVNRPVNSLQELSGVKLRTAGALEAKFSTMLGAVPTTVSLPEVYTALQQKVLDGIWIPDNSIYDMKLYEVVGHTIDLNIGGASGIIPINKDSFEQLPPDVQAVLNDPGLKSEFQQKMLELYIETDKKYRQLLIDSGMNIIEWSDSDMQKLDQTITQLIEEWKQDASEGEIEYFNKIEAMNR